MEFLNGRCPVCKGELQIPAHLDEIICMYCGEKVRVQETRPETLKEDVTDELAQDCCEGLKKVFFAEKEPLQTFKRTLYEKHFQEMYAEQEEVFQKIAKIYHQAVSYKEVYQKIIDPFLEEILKRFEGQKPRKAEALLMDYNMVLVVYLIPGAMHADPEAGACFAEQLLEKWKEHFPKADLKAATFEEINGGFRRRYCYITTATCKSLGKGESCEELELLRDFRDHYMSAQENGEKMIQEYYDIAPTIVKRIDRLPDQDDIYHEIWEKYIQPCIEMIRADQLETCMKHYAAMVCDLQQKYLY